MIPGIKQNRSGNGIVIWTGIMTSVFLSDTIIKSWAESHLSEKAVKEVAGDKILLRKLHNSGMACNIGENVPDLVEKGTLALWVAVFAGYLKLLGESGRKLSKLGGALIVGGGLSNLTDRITKGYVTDYFSLNVKWEKLRNLVFNISDFFILIGGCLVFLGQMGKKNRDVQ